MLHTLNENYLKIIKKLPQQYTGMAWKYALYLILMITWSVILVGTFLLLK